VYGYTGKLRASRQRTSGNAREEGTGGVQGGARGGVLAARRLKTQPAYKSGEEGGGGSLLFLKWARARTANLTVRHGGTHTRAATRATNTARLCSSNRSARCASPRCGRFDAVRFEKQKCSLRGPRLTARARSVNVR